MLFMLLVTLTSKNLYVSFKQTLWIELTINGTYLVIVYLLAQAIHVLRDATSMS